MVAGLKEYTFSNRQTGHEFRERLVLRYEVNGSPMSDDYSADEADAEELLRKWCARYGDTDDGFQSIYWGVTTPEVRGIFEHAPFQATDRDHEDRENFLTFFTWPVDGNGERVNWMTLPVLDLSWRTGNADKGGFIQEATGWKPGPLQERVYVPMLLNARG